MQHRDRLRGWIPGPQPRINGLRVLRIYHERVLSQDSLRSAGRIQRLRVQTIERSGVGVVVLKHRQGVPVKPVGKGNASFPRIDMDGVTLQEL